jgi:hypothetical protein
MDAQSQTDLKEYADRLEHLCRAQQAEIQKLRDEAERLRAEGGAHAALKDVYLNPNSSAGNKIKAAAASLPFERPKLMSEQAPLELRAQDPEDLIPLSQLVEQRRARQDRLEGRPIEIVPDPSSPLGQRVNLLAKSNGNGGDQDGE